MEIRALFTDDDAVAPVIGVILVVAITVILAALIASFVLGLGQDTTNTSPQASFSFDYTVVHENPSSVDAGYTVISHDGGDNLNDAEIYIRGSGFNSSTSAGDTDRLDVKEWGDVDVVHHRSTGSWNGTKSGPESTIVSGDQAIASVDSDYEIDVVWQSQQSKSSSTLAEDEGPDA